MQYIDRLKTAYKWYFSFGITLHRCVEYFYKVNTPPPPSLNELIQFYRKNWISKGYQTAAENKKYKDYGQDILTSFWEAHSTDFQMPLAVERMFFIDIDGVKLRGFMDRVDKLESGGLSIVDYKTNQGLFTIDDLENDLQLTLYQMAAEQTWQLPVERLTLYHLRSNTPCSCPPRDAARLEQVRRMVSEVAENIARQNFPATENQYCPCDFPEYCPYYRQQYMETVPELARQEPLPGLVVADAVESYVSLQQEIKELQVKLDEVKEAIVAFCQKEALNRVHGSEHAITCKLMERTGFSEDEVRALLEPEGLWDKVLSFDQSRLKQFLADEAVDRDIKNRLEALRRVVSTRPQLWVKKLTEEDEAI